MSIRHFNGYSYRKQKVSNLPGHFWVVTLDGKERSFRTRIAMTDHLRTLPRLKKEGASA